RETLQQPAAVLAQPCDRGVPGNGHRARVMGDDWVGPAHDLFAAVAPERPILVEAHPVPDDISTGMLQCERELAEVHSEVAGLRPVFSRLAPALRGAIKKEFGGIMNVQHVELDWLALGREICQTAGHPPPPAGRLTDQLYRLLESFWAVHVVEDQ